MKISLDEKTSKDLGLENGFSDRVERIASLDKKPLLTKESGFGEGGVEIVNYVGGVKINTISGIIYDENGKQFKCPDELKAILLNNKRFWLFDFPHSFSTTTYCSINNGIVAFGIIDFEKNTVSKVTESWKVFVFDEHGRTLGTEKNFLGMTLKKGTDFSPLAIIKSNGLISAVTERDTGMRKYQDLDIVKIFPEFTVINPLVIKIGDKAFALKGKNEAPKLEAELLVNPNLGRVLKKLNLKLETIEILEGSGYVSLGGKKFKRKLIGL